MGNLTGIAHLHWNWSLIESVGDILSPEGCCIAFFSHYKHLNRTKKNDTKTIIWFVWWNKRTMNHSSIFRLFGFAECWKFKTFSKIFFIPFNQLKIFVKLSLNLETLNQFIKFDKFRLMKKLHFKIRFQLKRLD